MFAQTLLFGVRPDHMEVCALPAWIRTTCGEVWAEFRDNIWLRIAASSVVVVVYLPHFLARIGFQFPVGGYIAILGGLAAVVTLRKEPSVREKACWILAITVLLFAEIHNLYTEAYRQNKEARAISDSLDETKKGLTKTVEGLSAVVGRLEGISGDITNVTNIAKDNLNETTDAGTYPEILALNPRIPGQPAPDLTLAIIAIGKYNLRNVEVTVRSHVQKTDTESIMQSLSTQIGTEVPIAYANRLTWTSLRVTPSGDGDMYDIQVVTPNKNFREILKLRSTGLLNLNAGWAQDYTIMDDYGHVFKKYVAPSVKP